MRSSPASTFCHASKKGPLCRCLTGSPRKETRCTMRAEIWPLAAWTPPAPAIALPFGAAPPPNPANRKHERMARRELLYAVVREAMVRAGVLSSSYKFKVLSLDPRGRQFLVMVDLAQRRQRHRPPGRDRGDGRAIGQAAVRHPGDGRVLALERTCRRRRPRAPRAPWPAPQPRTMSPLPADRLAAEPPESAPAPLEATPRDPRRASRTTPFARPRGDGGQAAAQALTARPPVPRPQPPQWARRRCGGPPLRRRASGHEGRQVSRCSPASMTPKCRTPAISRAGGGA